MVTAPRAPVVAAVGLLAAVALLTLRARPEERPADSPPPAIAAATESAVNGPETGSGLQAPPAPPATARARPGAELPATAPAPRGPDAGFVGRVAERDGRPIAGARLVLSTNGRDDERGRVRSGNDGRFELAPLPPGKYDLEITADGYTRADRLGLVLAAAQRFELAVRLEQRGALEGRVTDGAGRPVLGARVRCGPNRGRGEVEGEAVTGADGRFRLAGLSAGSAQLRARRPEAERGVTRYLEVEGGRTTTVELVLPAAGVLEGTVVRASGAPLAGPAGVLIEPDAAPRTDRDSLELSSDEAGRFRVALLAGAWKVRAVPSTRSGFVMTGDAGTRIVVEADGTTRAEVTLEERARAPDDLTVEVRGPDGAPAVGARVELAAAHYRAAFPTGPDGQARLRRPASEDGPWWVSARLGGQAAPARVVAIEADEVAVVLVPGASVSGRVVDPAGAPVQGFTVALRLPGPGDHIRMGDDVRLEFAGDRFELPEVPSGPCRLVVTTHDARRAERELSLAPGAAAELEIALGRPEASGPGATGP